VKTLRNIALLMLAIVALCVLTQPAQAQSLEVRMLLADRGWHGIGGGIQAHQPTLEFQAPYVGVWERSPQGYRYGAWTYVRVLFNCQQWSYMPIATLEDQQITYLEELTGVAPVARWPERDTVPYQVMTAVCGLYGYTHQPQPKLIPNPNGEPYVGGIERLDKP
jgi:hypothetical protein